MLSFIYDILPSRVIFGVGCLDKPHAQLVQHLLEQLTLFEGEVAARFLIEQREDLDHLGGAIQVERGPLAGHGIGQVAEMNRRRAGQ